MPNISTSTEPYNGGRRTWRSPFPAILAPLLLLGSLISSPTIRAQNIRYPDYPQTRGQADQIVAPFFPRSVLVDGEIRARFETQTAIGDQYNNSDTYLLTRIRTGLKVTPDPHLTFYGQIQDTHALGLPLRRTSSNMRDTFDLRQGYVDLQGRGIRLIAGRQELKFGSERIIGVSDFTNNARSFDGFDLRLGSQNNKLDLFSTSVVSVHPTAIDTHGPGLTFHGAYGSFASLIPHATVQPFLLLHTLRSRGNNNWTTKKQMEITPGVEVAGTLPHNFDYAGMIALQRGSYGAQSIRSGAGFMKLAYTAPRLFWSPRIGAEFDYATGNSPSHPLDKRTFDQEYPSNHDVFGLVDLFGFQNIRQERINLDLAPSKYLTVLVQGGNLSLASRFDSVYDSGGSALRSSPTSGFQSKELGKEIDFSAKYLFRESVVLNVGYGHLFSSSSIKTDKGINSDSLGYISLTYRFNLGHF